MLSHRYYKMVTVIDKSSVYEYIIDSIVDSLKNTVINDEDDYYDELNIAIDEWITGSTGEMKELVEDYGVLNAIRLYKENFGEFELDDDDNKVYMILAFTLIKEWFDNYYSFNDFNKDTDEDE